MVFPNFGNKPPCMIRLKKKTKKKHEIASSVDYAFPKVAKYHLGVLKIFPFHVLLFSSVGLLERSISKSEKNNTWKSHDDKNTVKIRSAVLAILPFTCSCYF